LCILILIKDNSEVKTCYNTYGSLVPAGESSNLLVPIINPPFADTAGKYAHPTPENKRKVVEVLAAVLDKRSETNAYTHTGERTSIVTSMSGNK